MCRINVAQSARLAITSHPLSGNFPALRSYESLHCVEHQHQLGAAYSMLNALLQINRLWRGHRVVEQSSSVTHGCTNTACVVGAAIYSTDSAGSISDAHFTGDIASQRGPAATPPRTTAKSSSSTSIRKFLSRRALLQCVCRLLRQGRRPCRSL
jgi:hypothetical protein